MDPSISSAEAQLLQVLWARHPLTAEEIAKALADRQDWQLGTVKTLLNRLLNKGAVAAERDGKRYLYSPLVERTDWERRESLNVLDRLFGGRIAPLIAHFSSQRRLSEDDLAALRRLLDGQEGDGDAKR